MTTMLLSALGALLCSLVVTAEVMPQGDFNLQGVAGKWYVIGFATNAQWFVKHRADMKMGTTILTPTADGDLDIAYTSRNADGSCWRMNHLAKKTNLAGKFIYNSERKSTTYKHIHTRCTNGPMCDIVNSTPSRPSLGWSNENDMRVVDVKYDEYALIHTKTKDVSSVLTNLYGKILSTLQNQSHCFTIHYHLLKILYYEILYPSQYI
uniref:Zgc:153704 n=1 Tax=Hucho hucho TaxID=62062 RepID=A0A4W5RN13_9TELE